MADHPPDVGRPRGPGGLGVPARRCRTLAGLPSRRPIAYLPTHPPRSASSATTPAVQEASMLLEGWYSPLVVLLSVLIASLASYTALDLAGRVSLARDRERLAWIACGAVAMGVGIWSMHFVGMLAFHLPVPITYAAGLVLLSVLVAIVASAFALQVVGRRTLTPWALALSALWMGPAIAGMHYIGMAAMRVDARQHYD